MHFGILGPLQVTSSGELLSLGAAAKPRSVLGLLLVHANETLPAERLIDDVWEGNPPRSASTALQTYISQLRKQLGPDVLQSAQGGYRLHVEPGAIDADRFEMALREAAPVDGPDADAERLRDALAMWRGPALTDFVGAHWAASEAARLEGLRQTAVEELIEARLATGEHAWLVSELEALVSANPLRERQWAQLMVALYRSDRQADALRAFQRLRSRLAEELGIEPSRELARLEQAILSQESHLDWRPPTRSFGQVTRGDLNDSPAVPRVRSRHGRSSLAPSDERSSRLPSALAVLRDGPFVGRQAELTGLAVAWQQASNGCARAVLVAGEPGAGKSRLVAEFANRIARSGGLVLHGRCDNELGVAFQPFTEALRRLMDLCPPEELHAHVGDRLAGLVRLLPELAEQLPNLPPPRQADPATERYDVFDAILAALAAASRHTPVYLVIDDLHWSAKPTMLFMRHLLRSSEHAPVLVAATYRDTEIQMASTMSELLGDIRRLPNVEEMTLGGLTRDQVQEYVAATTGTSDSVAVAQQVWQQTEGLPLFVREAVRDLDNQGAGHLSATLPIRIRDLIEQRLSRLSQPTRQLLSVAAVIGPTFSVTLLERLGIPASGTDAVLRSVDEAIRAGMVLEPVNRADALVFTHALIQQAVEGNLTGARRTRLHLQIAEAIEGLESIQTSSERLPALALHYAAAAPLGYVDRATRYALQAAKEAQTRVSFEEAVEHLERGLRTLEALPHPDSRRRAELLLALAQARLVIVDIPGVADAVRRVVEDVTLRDPALLARALRRAVGLGTISTPDQATTALCQRAIEATRDADPRVRSEVLASVAFHRAWVESEGGAAAPLAEEALALARSCGDVGAIDYALYTISMTLVGSSRANDRLRFAEELVCLARACLDESAQTFQVEQRASARLVVGDITGSRADVFEFTRLAGPNAPPFVAASVEMWQALDLLLQGRFAEAEAHADAMLALAGQLGDFTNAYAALLFFSRREQGRLAEILSFLVDQSRANPTMDSFRIALAISYLDLGEPETARQQLAALASDDFAAVPRDATWPASLWGLSEACASLRDRRRAAMVHTLFQPHSGQLVVLAHGLACLGAVDRSLAMLETTLGMWEAAEEHFERALDLERHTGSGPLLARTKYWFGLMLLERGLRGDRSCAKELLADAQRISSELGMTRLAEQAEARLGVRS